MYQWDTNYGYYDVNGYFYHAPDSQSGPLVAALACPPAVIADISDPVTAVVHPSQQQKMDQAQIVRSATHNIDTNDPVTKAVVDNIVGNLPTKKPQPKLTCNVCNIQVSGQHIMEEHLAGVKHARKVKSVELMKEMKNMITDGNSGCLDLKNNTYTCQPCNVIVNSIQQLQVHCQGSKHKSKITSENGLVMNGEIQKGDAMSNRYYCSTCNVRVNSDTQLEQHKMSKKHTGKLGGGAGTADLSNRSVPYSINQRKTFVKEGRSPAPSCNLGNSGTLRCNVCNVSVNSHIQLQQHNFSKKHRDKLIGVPNEQMDTSYGNRMETNQQPTPYQTSPMFLRRQWVSPQNENNTYSYSPPMANNGGGSSGNGYNVNMYQKWSTPTFSRSQHNGYGRY